jgi:hypothetical protein
MRFGYGFITLVLGLIVTLFYYKLIGSSRRGEQLVYLCFLICVLLLFFSSKDFEGGKKAFFKRTWMFPENYPTIEKKIYEQNGFSVVIPKKDGGLCWNTSVPCIPSRGYLDKRVKLRFKNIKDGFKVNY